MCTSETINSVLLLPRWQQRRVPNGYWKDASNRRNYMDWLGGRLQIRKPADWYRLTVSDLQENHGHSFYAHYYEKRKLVGRYTRQTYLPHVLALREYLPNIQWLPWKFDKVPRGFWNWRKNRRWYMSWLQEELKIKEPQDWYRVQARDVEQRYGKKLLMNTGSLYELVTLALPDHEWLPWLFSPAPHNSWRRPTTRREYMDWLGLRLGFVTLDDWNRNLTAQHFRDNHGASLLANVYKGSPLMALVEYAPHYDWKEWLLPVAPKGFFKWPKHRRRFVKWLGGQLGYEQPEDWYEITNEHFLEHEGKTVLRYYGGSAKAAVRDAFPECDFTEWLFGRVKIGYWERRGHRQQYMKWLGVQYGFTKKDDWYGITLRMIQDTHGAGMLNYYKGSPAAAVIDCFPDYAWQPEKFGMRLKAQKRMYEVVKELFQNETVKWNYWHRGIRYRKTNRPMQIDVYIPALKLALEYQGEQHFIPMAHWGGKTALKELRQRDREKRRACKKAGITLVEIDYGWNGTRRGLLDASSELCRFIKE